MKYSWSKRFNFNKQVTDIFFLKLYNLANYKILSYIYYKITPSVSFYFTFLLRLNSNGLLYYNIYHVTLEYFQIFAWLSILHQIRNLVTQSVNRLYFIGFYCNKIFNRLTENLQKLKLNSFDLDQNLCIKQMI